jgi:hypothetical protein
MLGPPALGGVNGAALSAPESTAKLVEMRSSRATSTFAALPAGAR